MGAGVGRVSWVGLLHAQGLPYALRSSFFGLVPGELVLGGVRELQVVLLLKPEGLGFEESGGVRWGGT